MERLINPCPTCDDATCFAGPCDERKAYEELCDRYQDLNRTPEELKRLVECEEHYLMYEGSKLDKADQYIERLENELAEYRRQKEDGTLSDGYHTFNELYHHRAVLFSVICNANPLMAWKSKKHHDGTMYDGMFIVGIETPDGQATYHYDMIPYWDMFNVKELFYAPEWDGHTPQDAIWRIGNLRKEGGNQ